MALRLSQDIRQLVEEAEALGFTMTKTRGGHLRFDRPGCQPVFSASTPGDRRTANNTLSQLRRSARGQKT